MAKPFYVTTTRRPVAKTIQMAEDVLSVKKVNALTPEDKQKLEAASGMTIVNDVDLLTAKTTILKKPIIKSDTLSAIPLNTNEVVEQLSDEDSMLAKYLALTEEEQAECEKMFSGFTAACGWFNDGKNALLDKIALGKYGDKMKGWLVDIKASMLNASSSLAQFYSDSTFGTLVRCGAFYAKGGIENINSVMRDIIDSKGSVYALEHMSEGIHSFYDVLDDTGAVIQRANIKAYMPDYKDLFLASIANTERQRLSEDELSNVLLSMNLSQRSLFSNNGDYMYSGNQYPAYTPSNAVQLVKTNETQITNKTALVNITVGRIDKSRLQSIVAISGDIPEETIAMSSSVVDKINVGDIPETILTDRQLYVYNSLPPDTRTIKQAIILANSIDTNYSFDEFKSRLAMITILNTGRGNLSITNTNNIRLLQSNVTRCDREQMPVDEYKRVYTKTYGVYA